MANAKVLMHKPCADVFSEFRELIAVGLDVPQITRVASALRDRGIDIGEDVYTVDYAVGMIEAFMKTGKTAGKEEKQV